MNAVAAPGLPLSRRREGDIRDRIRSGELVPGAKVETEVELMDRYGVSRATVRHALQILRDEGLVQTFAGRGTFVANPG